MSRKFTQADVDAFNAKRDRHDFDCAISAPLTPESRLHNQILDECRRRGWLVFHGSMAHRTYRTPGEPDFVILAGSWGAPRTFFIECKTGNKKPSQDQLGVIAHAAKLGHTVHVVRSFEQFLEVMK